MLQHGGTRPPQGQVPRDHISKEDFYTKHSRGDETFKMYMSDREKRDCVYRAQGRCLERFCLGWSTPFCGGCTCFILCSIGVLLFFAYLQYPF